MGGSARAYAQAPAEEDQVRVQIHPAHDMWMRGDRYGEVVRTFTIKIGEVVIARARVKLDKSGKTITVNFDDCEVID